MGRVEVRTQVAVIEVAEGHADGQWLTMFPDGVVRPYRTAEEASQAIDKWTAQQARKEDRRGAAVVFVTRLEWRNLPAGFRVPEESVTHTTRGR